MKSKRDKIIEQIKLMEIIRQEANINIVDCGNCGSTFLHKRSTEGLIHCPYCEKDMDQSDCPDFLYENMQNNAEFNTPTPFTFVEGEKWARKCDATDEGMNEGYCVGDGTDYFKYEPDLIAFLRKQDYVTADNENVNEKYPNDKDFLEWCYNDEIYYHTAWEDKTDFQYIVKDGELIDIEE